MAVITPNSDVIFLHVPLEISDINQLTFANATAQFNYFNGLTNKKSFDKFTYLRKDNVIKVPELIDNLYDYNYVMYRNTEYSNKWFYAYITDLNYINDNVTAVTIKTDVWQTWQFQLVFKPTFVEREHVNDDTVGSNLIPESLECGEYISNGTPSTFTAGETLFYVINADKEPSSDINGNPTATATTYSTNAGGIPMSGGLYLYSDMATLTNAFLLYSRMTGGIDHIKNVYIIPAMAIGTLNTDYEFGDYELDEYAYYRYKGRATPVENSLTISAPTTINGYTPHNNKLLSAPYQFLLLSNNNGATNQLFYEYFSNRNSIVLKTQSVPSVGGSIFAYPQNYKNTTDNYNEGIIGGKYPTLSWSGDAFTNWLTQNSVNIGANIGATALGIGATAVTSILSGGIGSVIGVAAGMAGVNAATSQLTQIYDHSIVANSFKGNINGGDVITSYKKNTIYIWKISITSEFAQIIDRFFDVYGYKINKVKIPNITGRTNWNYVKTIDCYIEANIPQDDLAEIKLMFDKGITLWHNPSTFADYTQSNTIVNS